MRVFLQAEVETRPTFGRPGCKFVNIVQGKSVGVVLLENPAGSGLISKAQLAEEVANVFGLDATKKRQVFADASLKQEIGDNLAPLDGKTVYLRHETSRVTLSGDDGASFCRFVLTKTTSEFMGFPCSQCCLCRQAVNTAYLTHRAPCLT